MIEVIRKDYIKCVGKNATHIEVELYYDVGGYSYFTGKESKRGYYVSVTPVEKDGLFISYTLFTGIKTCVLPVKRRSAKSLEKAKENAELVKERLVRQVLYDNDLTIAA